MDDLNVTAEEHLTAARASAHGRSAHLVLQEPPLRQTVIALTEGTALDEHNAPPRRTRSEAAGGALCSS
ncbi:cupin, partial [Streptomyces sp. MBT56]|nr:cupin [Streptomyces sp. MBT56]